MKRLSLYVFPFLFFTNFAFSQSPNTGSSFNPQTSVNALTLYKRTKQETGFQTQTQNNGFSLQEVEMQFQADVDPYLRASALLSVHPDGAGGYAIEPEEVFAETSSLPYFTVKAGRFHVAFGRHNALHTHAFPFIEAPLINQSLLGEDGFTEVGVSVETIFPLPWYSEFIVQGIQGESDTLFASTDSNAKAWVGRFRNLFDLSSETTLDIGVSGTYGRNVYDRFTDAEGVDITLKWRPQVGGKYYALIIGTEGMQGHIKGRPEQADLLGFASYVQYQFAERWWIQGRGEMLRDNSNNSTTQGQGNLLRDNSDNAMDKKYSVLLAFFPSEFSGLRLEYDRWIDPNQKARDTFMLQGNYTIGAHPAHSY